MSYVQSIDSGGGQNILLTYHGHIPFHDGSDIDASITTFITLTDDAYTEVIRLFYNYT